MGVLSDFCLRLPKCCTSINSGFINEHSCIFRAFKIFPLVQRLTEREEELRMATESVIKEFAAENVVYLELRTTPKITKWMSKQKYVDTVIDAIRAMELVLPQITVRLLLSIDRRQSVAEATETVRLAAKYLYGPSSIVIGIELSGDPIYSGEKFVPLLENVSDSGIPFTIHVAEVLDQLDELKACLLTKPNRLGHGTFIHKHPDEAERQFCEQIVLSNKIPIEICLTSNLLCGTTTSYSSSHFGYYLSKKHPVVLCTDDRGIMGCTLTDEFLIAAETFKLSRQAMFDVAFQSFEAAFINKWDAKGNSCVIRKIFTLFQQFAENEDLICPNKV
uniref:A_deaminase domain-containing protein n=1 Tax=Syphacia muris TaxID=451379 RepID=A0A0N5ARM1_9BILA